MLKEERTSATSQGLPANADSLPVGSIDSTSHRNAEWRRKTCGAYRRLMLRNSSLAVALPAWRRRKRRNKTKLPHHPNIIPVRKVLA